MGHAGNGGRYGGSFPAGAELELLGNVQSELILARPRSIGIWHGTSNGFPSKRPSAFYQEYL
jgi:hypothetical protein